MWENFDITKITNWSLENYEKYADIIIEWILSFWPKVLGAIFVLWIWFKIVNMANRALNKVMDKANLDPMLESFISSLLVILLKVLIVISAAWIVWVETTSFIAMLAAAWLAIGMALSWTLQNFAWWVMILLLKPYKIWDFIDTAWFAGTVDKIQIFNTILITLDKKTIIIPNSDIINKSITNFSSEPVRRVDLVIWVSYSDDIDLVKETLKEIALSEPRILENETINITMANLWDSSVDFNFRFFVNSSDYWPTRWDILEKIKKTFDEKGISFPFPHREVYINNK